MDGDNILRCSSAPGDFLVECDDCKHRTSFRNWPKRWLCRVSGEAQRECPNCGCDRNRIITTQDAA